MSGFSRFRAALDGVSGLGRGFLAAKGGLKARLQAVLGSAAGQRNAMAVLRFAKPHLQLKQNLITCYEAEGALMVTRAADFHAVIERQDQFQVVYGSRMRMLTGGRDFFLGMQDGPDYRRDTGAMRSIVKPDDLGPAMAMARAEAAEALAGPEVDLPPSLSARTRALMMQRYLGVEMEAEQLIADATVMFHFLFSDLAADPAITAAAMAAKDRVNAAIDASAATAGPDTLLGRAVAAGKAGSSAFDADGIRANIIGIVIGAIPTLSKASCLALKELLRRLTAFAAVRPLAQAGNKPGVADHLWEALRFNPVNLILYRRAATATRIGDTEVAANSMVLAANSSAMFDEETVEQPTRCLAWG
ncbi:MAG: cytochrome P450 [Sandaracinobacter sp.]